MYKNKKVSLILLLSGSGNRFKSDIPKQFHNISGKKIYLHALDTFYKLDIFDEIIVVCLKDWIPQVKKDLKSYKNIKIIPGGKFRQQSSYLGLKACQNPKYVLFHDGVRPFVSKKIILDNLKSVIKHKAVDTCINSTDTLVQINDENQIEKIPNRKKILRGQTPQSFEYELILNAHKNAIKNNFFEATDDCSLVLEKQKIFVVTGDILNIKITNKLDLFLAEHIFRSKSLIVTNSKNISLEKKIFAVIGATGGIGSEIVKELKKEKATVLELSRNSFFNLDLKDPKSIKKTFEKIYKKYGKISGLINAAGILLVKPFKETTDQEIENLLKVNLSGLIYACKEAKILKKGHIINISSSSYFKGRKNFGIYSATKSAIVNFTQSLSEEFLDLNVNAIVPERTNTKMREKFFLNEDKKTLLNPGVIAKEIVKLLKSDLTGSIIEIKK